ncbi:hypothetical protein SK128_019645, partial [Halocaridina rubra]
LRWELFRLPELDCYQAMLNRLFKHELHGIVMSYEMYRIALTREIERRMQQMNISVSGASRGMNTGCASGTASGVIITELKDDDAATGAQDGASTPDHLKQQILNADNLFESKV